MTECEFYLCLYNKNGECILKNIRVSALGMCDDCLIPDIDNQTLEKIKKEMLERIKLK